MQNKIGKSNTHTHTHKQTQHGHKSNAIATWRVSRGKLIFLLHNFAGSWKRERDRAWERERERATHIACIFALAKKLFGHCFAVNGPRPIVSAAATRLSSVRQLLDCSDIACMDNFKLQVQLFLHHIGQSCQQLADIECRWGRALCNGAYYACNWPILRSPSPRRFCRWSNEPNELCKMSNGCHPLSHAGQALLLTVGELFLKLSLCL